MKEIISVKNLKKSFGQVEVIRDLSFEIGQGEFFGILGKNGAGKSTLIDCILGLKKYQRGEISVFGTSPAKMDKAFFEKIGVQFQQSHYQDKIKVHELCKLYSSYYKEPLDWKSLICSFELAGKENMFVEKLSGGEKQKLSVLLTLIGNPQIIFLDELTTGLDTLARRKVWSQLKLLKDQGVSVLLTSHYMDEVEILCDRIGIISDGKMAASGSVCEVIQKSGKKTLEEAFLFFTGEQNYENF